MAARLGVRNAEGIGYLAPNAFGNDAHQLPSRSENRTVLRVTYTMLRYLCSAAVWLSLRDFPAADARLPDKRPKTALTFTLLEIERTGFAPGTGADARP